MHFCFSDGAALGFVHDFFGLAGLVVGQAGAGRNEAADDDVFLQAAQVVALAHDGRFGEHARGFLEGGGADEAVGGQAGLGDAQQDVGVGGGRFAFGSQGVVGVEDFAALDLLAGDVVGVARVFNDHAAQHLAHDDFDVLVVDLHALQAVDVLHFIDDVAGQLFHAQQAQDVLRVGGAVHDALALVDDLAFVDEDVFLLGDEFFPHLAFGVGDLQADLALGFLAEGDGAGHFGQHALVFGAAGFKQLGHAG